MDRVASDPSTEGIAIQPVRVFVEHVVPAAAVHGVVARPGVDNVPRRPSAVDRVVAGPGVDRVLRGSAVHGVVAGPGIDTVAPTTRATEVAKVSFPSPSRMTWPKNARSFDVHRTVLSFTRVQPEPAVTGLRASATSRPAAAFPSLQPSSVEVLLLPAAVRREIRSLTSTA
jgi:hypothetical protein